MSQVIYEDFFGEQFMRGDTFRQEGGRCLQIVMLISGVFSKGGPTLYLVSGSSWYNAKSNNNNRTVVRRKRNYLHEKFKKAESYLVYT